MPDAPPRPCYVPSCPALVTAAHACPQHGRLRRGSTRAWRTRRMFVLRDAPLCVACELEGRTTLAAEIDHVYPRHLGGTDDYPNLQPLCAAHHAEKTALDRKET